MHDKETKHAIRSRAKKKTHFTCARARERERRRGEFASLSSYAEVQLAARLMVFYKNKNDYLQA